MKLPATIFREYDIRGTVGDELTGEVAYASGKAFATLATERLGRAARIAVGRDNRPSGVDLANQVVSGIGDAGSFALVGGPAPTRALDCGRHTPTADAGFQVTGRTPACWRSCATSRRPWRGSGPSSASRSTVTGTGSARWMSRGVRCSATSCWYCWAATWRAAWAPGIP